VERELCVSDIAEAVDLSQSAISHQLRFLKQMHLIKFRREGKNIVYSLADDHVRTILEMGLEHVME
jgi:DNA-binding transcriptional ArsR family regulator